MQGAGASRAVAPCDCHLRVVVPEGQDQCWENPLCALILKGFYPHLWRQTPAEQMDFPPSLLPHWSGEICLSSQCFPPWFPSLPHGSQREVPTYH